MIAVLIGIPTFRLSGHYFSMATIAVAELIRIVVGNWDFLGASIGLTGPATPRGWWDLVFRSSIPYYYLFLAVLAVLLAVTYWIGRSRVLGYYLRAIRAGERAARSLGVPVSRYKLYAFMLSATFTSLAGSLYAVKFGFVDPGSGFGILVSVNMVLIAALGGAGRLFGPLLGAAILIPLQTATNNLFRRRRHRPDLYPLRRNHHADRPLRTGRPAADVGSPARPLRRAARTSAAAATAANAKAGGFRMLLRAEGVSMSFGGFPAVSGVSLEIADGDIVGLIGPNGAGKSTFFNCLVGDLTPTAGRVLLNGVDVTRASPEAHARLGIGRTFQVPATFEELTILENVMVGAFLRHPGVREAREAAQRVLELTGLDTLAGQTARSLGTPGRKRLEIARVLATGPKLMLLDEALAGLTPAEVQQAIELVRKISRSGVTLVIVEHISGSDPHPGRAHRRVQPGQGDRQRRAGRGGAQ